MINILPYQQKKLVDRAQTLRIIVTAVFSLIVLLGLAALLFLPTLVTITSRHAIARNQLKLLEANGEIPSTLNVTDLDARIQKLSAKLASPLPTPPTEYIALLQHLSSSGITLTGFTMAQNAPAMTVTGTAKTRDALQQYIEQLKAAESVDSVESPVSNFVKNTNSDFNITVTFTTPS